MNLKIFILIIFSTTVLCRQIRKRKHELIHIDLIENGNNIRKVLRENLSNNITINFQLNDEQKQNVQSQNIQLQKLDHLEYAYKLDYIPLRNYFNAQYFGVISLGEQRQKFSMLFDTGSSYTWIAGEDCETCQYAGIRNFYDCEHSSTCQLEQKHISLEYGTGKAKAQMMTDEIEIGKLLIKNQTMLILQELTELKHYEGDGLGGLGFDTLSNGYPTLIDNLYSQQMIAKKEFSFYIYHQDLRAHDDKDESKKSQLIIGGYDEQYMEKDEEWHYCDVINNRYWAVHGDFIGFVSKDGNTIRQLNALKQVYMQENIKTDILMSSLFVIDSGTSIIALYENDHEKLIEYLKDFQINCEESQQYQGLTVCDEYDSQKYPDFQVSLCGKVYTIPPEKYTLCSFIECYLLIQSFDQKVSILGDLFISEYYTHFIQDNPRKIGFVKSKQ